MIKQGMITVLLLSIFCIYNPNSSISICPVVRGAAEDEIHITDAMREHYRTTQWNEFLTWYREQFADAQL